MYLTKFFATQEAQAAAKRASSSVDCDAQPPMKTCKGAGASGTATYNLLDTNIVWSPTDYCLPTPIAPILSVKYTLSFSYEVDIGDLALKYGAPELKKLKEACMVYSMKKEEEVCFAHEEERDGRKLLLLPRMLGTHVFGEALTTSLWQGSDMHPETKFVGKLHNESPPQVEAVDAMWTQMQSKGGALLQAPCGSGKTIMLLNLALEKVRKKTLWVCVRSNLLDQTKERLLMVAPNARVGTIKGSKKKMIEEMTDKDVCFCTVQMISNLTKELPKDLLATFGLVIIDEAHTVQTPVFMNMFKRLKPLYWATATATARRADKMFDSLIWHTGGMAVCMKRVWRSVALTWHIVKYTDLDGEEPCFETMKWGPMAGRPNFNSFLNFITCHHERNIYIVDLIKERLDEGKIMFVGSAWKQHIYKLWDLLASRHGIKAGLLLGGECKDLDSSVVFCTYAKAGFGVDKADINHLIDVTPWSNAAVTMSEQWLGRIRPSAEKKSPTMDSLVDNGRLGWSMMKKRKEYYAALDCTFTTVYAPVDGGCDDMLEGEGVVDDDELDGDGLE